MLSWVCSRSTTLLLEKRNYFSGKDRLSLAYFILSYCSLGSIASFLQNLFTSITYCWSCPSGSEVMKMTFPIWKAIGYYIAPLQPIEDHMVLRKHIAYACHGVCIMTCSLFQNSGMNIRSFKKKIKLTNPKFQLFLLHCMYESPFQHSDFQEPLSVSPCA